jgi:hypothetical protein
MHNVSFAVIALLSSTAIAAAGETIYLPHHAGGAIQVATRSDPNGSCSKQREVLACVVQLGAHNADRWAYLLVERDGTANSQVRYKALSEGAPCAAMAYPADSSVTVVGGPGDWFPGKISYACRE